MIFPRNGQIDPLVCHQRLYCCLQVDYYGENTRLFASLIAGSPDRPGAAADHLADKRLAQIRSLSIVGSQPLIGQHRDKTRIKSLSIAGSQHLQSSQWADGSPGRIPQNKSLPIVCSTRTFPAGVLALSTAGCLHLQLLIHI